MLRKPLFLALASALLALVLSPRVQAWGAYHAGYTSVGYGGVQHYGYTARSGPYGSYSGSREFSSYGGTTAYHASGTVNSGLWAGQGYHYSGVTATPGYGGGFGATGVYGSAYGAGVYRRW
jgi:hypothetical protein